MRNQSVIKNPTKKNQNLVAKASAAGIGGNILLSAFKLFAGLFGHSAAMLSDAVHSLSDVLATLIALVGVKVSRRSADAGHPYGHERFESIASEFLAAILFLTALGIGVSGVRTILTGAFASLAVPTLLPLVAALVSIIVKEGMFWYTRACAKKMHSSAFMADAWHHRSDALSSVGSLMGIAGARLGFPVLDSLASVVISFFILKVAVDVFRNAVDELTDRACEEAFTEKLRAFIERQPGVCGVDLLQTRLFGEMVCVDVEISADAGMSLEEAHAIAERVRQGLETNFETVKHVMVHVNPCEKSPQAISA